MTMMKKQRLIAFFLLLSMSFSMLHAYVIDELDTHPCTASEYVHNFTADSDCQSEDICHLHHFFHIAFLLPLTQSVVTHKHFRQIPQSTQKIYDFNSHNNFLKPPIL